MPRLPIARRGRELAAVAGRFGLTYREHAPEALADFDFRLIDPTAGLTHHVVGGYVSGRPVLSFDLAPGNGGGPDRCAVVVPVALGWARLIAAPGDTAIATDGLPPLQAQDGWRWWSDDPAVGPGLLGPTGRALIGRDTDCTYELVPGSLLRLGPAGAAKALPSLLALVAALATEIEHTATAGPPRAP